MKEKITLAYSDASDLLLEENMPQDLTAEQKEEYIYNVTRMCDGLASALIACTRIDGIKDPKGTTVTEAFTE